MKTESREQRIAFIAVAFIAGLLIGWIIAGPETLPQPAMPNATASERSVFVPQEIAFENSVNPVLEHSPASILSDLERFLEQAAAEEMVVVPVSSLEQIRPMSRGRLSNAMVEALALSEEEVKRVNQIFEDTEEKLNESELERLEIVSVSDNEVIFHIPRDIEAGWELEKEFRQQFIDVLGDIDGAFFMTVHDYSYASDIYFHEFGKVDRTITFAVNPGSADMTRLRFWDESPRGQLRFGHDATEEMATWPGFETLFPSPFPGHPNSTGRSKFLIPLLPEPMRSQFEALEQASEEYHAAQKIN